MDKIISYLICAVPDMNGLLISALIISSLCLLYLILKISGWFWSRHNQTERGTEGLPGIDSNAGRTTPWTIIGNILYWFYSLPCRLCCN